MSEIAPRRVVRPAGTATVGLISDTHGLLRPEALAALRGADYLVHAGDIGRPDILASLRGIAPLTAVRGNNDTAAWAANVPLTDDLVVGAVRIHVIHEVAHLKRSGLPPRTDVVVYGHSHRPAIERRDASTSTRGARVRGGSICLSRWPCCTSRKARWTLEWCRSCSGGPGIRAKPAADSRGAGVPRPSDGRLGASLLRIDRFVATRQSRLRASGRVAQSP